MDAFFRKYLASGSVTAALDSVLERYGLRISYKLACRMLDSPTYTGTFYGAEGMVPAYITKEESQKIQSMRKRPVRKTLENRVYLFSGLISCGECGMRMIGRHNARARYPAYNCAAHYTRRSACGNKVNMNEHSIEQYLFSKIDEKMEKYRLEAARFASERRERNYKAEISALRGKLARLKELFLNEYITLEEYRNDHEAVSRKLQELMEKDKPLQMRNFKRLEDIWLSHWRDDYDTIGREEKRGFWRVLIKEIRIYPDREIDFDLNI